MTDYIITHRHIDPAITQHKPLNAVFGQQRSPIASQTGIAMPMTMQTMPAMIRNILAILFLLLGCAQVTLGQAARFDLPLLVTGPNTSSGNPQALFLANATVQVCTHPATANSCIPAATFTDPTEATQCAPTLPLVILPGTTCTANGGTAGRVGFWYSGSVVDYFVSNGSVTLGPFSAAAGSATGTSGFPFTLGSTPIPANSAITAVTNLEVNGVELNSAGSTSLFLNQAGQYASPTSSSIADVTISVPSFAIPANTCDGSSGSTTPATVTMTGLTTSLQVTAGFTANPAALVGWGTAGGLNIAVWPSATNTASYVICNSTASSITGSAISFVLAAK
jgi:hypothetical protein